MNFECWEVKFEAREGNQAADKLAKDRNVYETETVSVQAQSYEKFFGTPRVRRMMLISLTFIVESTH